MKKSAISLCLAFLAVAGSASAQADPDPNGIGIYYDLGATVTCTDLEPDLLHSQFLGYLCITNPSESSGIAALEFHLDRSGPVALSDPEWDVPAINCGTGGDMLIGFATPLPAAPVVVLVELFTTVFAPTPADFFLTPVQNTQPTVAGQMIYSPADDPGNFQILHGPTGGPESPVFTINGDCPPVASASSTWGGVKSLYRAR